MRSSGTPRDFIEFPSQFMEHYAAQPEVLAVYAKHAETGEVIPRRDFNASGELIDRIAEAFAAEGADAWFVEGAKGRFLEGLVDDPDAWDKVGDILDVWFDSGSTHAFVLEQRPDLKWPASLYLEGSDQHRGWFHSYDAIWNACTFLTAFKRQNNRDACLKIAECLRLKTTEIITANVALSCARCFIHACQDERSVICWHHSFSRAMQLNARDIAFKMHNQCSKGDGEKFIV